MKRHALYFAPPPGPLADVAARWLGRDAVTGARLVPPHPDLEALSAKARRYGFHATLKAPFRLAPGQTPEALVAAVDAFAAGVPGFALDGLHVAVLDGFLALVPQGDTATLDGFAAQVVRVFEPFRAPLTPEDRARRHPDRLSPRQRDLLDRYGYPHVFEEFRFHMTLSDRLDARQQAILRPLAEQLFGAVLPRPFPVASLCVFAEDETGLFHEVHRAALA